MRKKKGTRKKATATNIPLDAIPERSHARRVHTDDFKITAAKRVIEGGESREHVAAELGLAPSLISGWVKKIRAGEPVSKRGGTKPAAAPPAKLDGWNLDLSSVRRALNEAIKARDERLEIAAAIVELDGPAEAGANLAKHIRDLKRQPPPQ